MNFLFACNPPDPVDQHAIVHLNQVFKWCVCIILLPAIKKRVCFYAHGINQHSGMVAYAVLNAYKFL